MNSNINDCDNIIIIIVGRLTLQVSAPCCVRLNNIYIILLTRFYPAAAVVNRNRSRKLELFQNTSTTTQSQTRSRVAATLCIYYKSASSHCCPQVVRNQVLYNLLF